MLNYMELDSELQPKVALQMLAETWHYESLFGSESRDTSSRFRGRENLSWIGVGTLWRSSS
jgi:hypothetical protein